jgi:hypothetical protein
MPPTMYKRDHKIGSVKLDLAFEVCLQNICLGAWIIFAIAPIVHAVFQCKWFSVLLKLDKSEMVTEVVGRLIAKMPWETVSG